MTKKIKTLSGKRRSKTHPKSMKKTESQKKQPVKKKPSKTSKPPQKPAQTKNKSKVKLTKPVTKPASPAKKRTSGLKKTEPKKVVKKRVAQSLKKEEVLKKQLIKKRAEIINEAKNEIKKYVKGEARQLVDTALDDGDLSVIDLSEDINLSRLGAHRGSLLKIDEALRKINEGTYGICEDCGEKISAERLGVMPFAIYCRDCQEKREELEKIESEEL